MVIIMQTASLRRSPVLLQIALVFAGILLAAPANQGQTPAEPDSRQLQQLEAVTSLPSSAKRWALVIGVDQYVDSQISPLKGAANDARMLAASLVRYAGFPEDQVILLATDQPSERQPTRVNILRRLANLSGAVPKDGLLLVSFAGHGMERSNHAYLLPADAQIADEISFLEDTALSVARIKERIKAMGVKQVMILLDACRNDPGGRADAPNNLSQNYVNALYFDRRNHEVEAFAVLYATAIGQRAYEYGEKRQGYFTWAVVEGLKGGAANERGEVTLAQLVNYIQEAVPKRITIDLGAAKQQRPFATIEGYLADQLVLSVSDPRRIEPTSIVAAGNDAETAEATYWESIKNSSNPGDFKGYLRDYPQGQFSELASNRLKALTAPAAEPNGEEIDRATELAFWDSVKSSSNLADFNAYLKKFPKGQFVELANNRVKLLEAEAKKERQKEASIKLAHIIQEQTKSFKIMWGYRGGLTQRYWPAQLIVHPGYLQFIDEGGQNIQWNCPSFTEAVVDGEYIREISCGVGRCRIKAASRAAATEVFEAVNRTCKIKIGLSIERLTPERAGQLGLDRNSAGLVVVTVLPGSMAEKSGIMAGDILEEIMDLPVAKPEEAVAALRAAADRGAKVLINRRGEQMVLTIGP
jgi:hypothetical protein